MLANCIQQHTKKIIHNDQVGVIQGMQGWYNICKSINVIHHIKKRKDKFHMIMSRDEEKAFDKIQHPFMIKNTQQSGNRRSIPQYDKGHLRVATANIIVNGEKLKAFSLRSQTRQG